MNKTYSLTPSCCVQSAGLARRLLWKAAAVVFTLFAPAAAVQAQAQQADLTLADVAAGKYYPQYVYGINPLSDGESYTQLSSDGQRIVRHSFKNDKELDVLFDASTARGDAKLKAIDGYIISPDGRRILLRTQTKSIYRRSYTAVYYIYDRDNKSYEPLSDGGPQQQPLFSPDGENIAFVRDGNLFLVKLLFGNAESQVTKDGEFNKIINGLPDWVNEEEFSTARSFDFSADGTMLAWVRYDESQVPIYSMQMYKGDAPALEGNDAYPGAYNYKYPVAGEQNSRVTVMTFDIQSRATRTVKLPLDEDGYVPRIKFTDNPDMLAIVTLNRRQNRMDIYAANPRSTECKLLVREETDKYLPESTYGSLRFYPGEFAYISDRSGYKHIYLYSLTGKLIRPLTKGSFDVSDFYGYDPATKQCFYASHEESPLRTAVYVSNAAGKVKKLSTAVGTNRATFSTSYRYFINVYSSLRQPPVTTLCSATDGKTLTTLIDNAALKQQTDPLLGHKELFSFTTADGVQLNGWMIKPRNFDASRRYPVIMYQYSGPGSQEVTDSWSMGLYPGGAFESYLAAKGFIVACVDGRGTGGRGADFEKCTYLRLGETESHDQAMAARYIGSLPYVDARRIGIWGWSFGGFNTLMSMSEGSDVFSAGVAVAAPSNWKYYDTIYTERYMRTPKENPEGYAINPITRAPKLHGDLLLIHGTADDNVHFRNFTEVSEAYVQNLKPFRQQVYTNRNHFITGGQTRLHLMTTIADFFTEKLKP